MTRFVVTGFGQFCGVDDNPTEALIKLLQDRLNGGDALPDPAYSVLCTEVLECAGQSVRAWAERLYGTVLAPVGTASETPLVVLHMGVDGTASHFKLEQQAANEATFRVPDQAGWRPSKRCIDDHPGLTLSSRLQTSLDVSVLQADLSERRHDVHTSQDAGRYVCNYTYYLSLLHTQKLRQRHGRPLHTLFLHVPPAEVVPLLQQLHLLLDLLQAIAAQLASVAPPGTSQQQPCGSGLSAAAGEGGRSRAAGAAEGQQAHALAADALR